MLEALFLNFKLETWVEICTRNFNSAWQLYNSGIAMDVVIKLLATCLKLSYSQAIFEAEIAIRNVHQKLQDLMR